MLWPGKECASPSDAQKAVVAGWEWARGLVVGHQAKEVRKGPGEVK